MHRARRPPGDAEKEKPRRSGAFSRSTWRREPESNRPKRLCRPLHNRFAIAPKADCRDAVRQATDFHSRTGSPSNKKGSVASPLLGAGDESRTRDLNLGKVALYQLSYSRIVLHLQRFADQHAARKIWSGRRVSNSRPQPWQGCALPTELLPHVSCICSALPTNTLPEKIWSGRRVSNSRPQPWQGCALPTELLPRIATLLLPRHTLTSSCSGEARLCRRHIRVSRAFPALFTKTAAHATQVTRRRARESAATRASCSTASTRSSAPRQDTSATRPTRACRSSRRRAAAVRRTAASESRPSGTRS